MSASPPRSFAAAVAGDLCPPGKVEVSYGEVQGCPAVFISDDDMRALARPFSFTLFGKFSVSRPPLDVIRSFVVRMRFFGKVFVDPLDRFHVSFRFADSRDYIRFFARRSFQVFGVGMRVFKWSPFIDFDEELPIFPIWVSFPGIRFQLFHASTLLDIAGSFGKALCVDSTTAALGNLSCARVLVEVDISRPIPDRIWLGSQESGFFQKVVFENLPSFCHRCMVCGHAESDCRRPPGGVALSESASAPPGPMLQGGSVALGGNSPGPHGSLGGPSPASASLPASQGLDGTPSTQGPLLAREVGGLCPSAVQVVTPISGGGTVDVLGGGVGASVPGGVMLPESTSAPPGPMLQGGSVALGGISPGPLGSLGVPDLCSASLPASQGLDGTTPAPSPLLARVVGGLCSPPAVRMVPPISGDGLGDVLGGGVGASVPVMVARLDGVALGGPSLPPVGLAGISRESASLPDVRAACNHSTGGEGDALLLGTPPGVVVDRGSVEDGSESAESLIMETCEEGCGRILPASFRLAGGGCSAPLNLFPVGFPSRGVSTRSMVKAGRGDGLLHDGKGIWDGSGGSQRNKKGKKGKRKKSESRLSYESSHAMASAFQALFKVPSYD